VSERVEREIRELEKDNEKAEKSIETLEQGINTNLVAINGLKHLLELEDKEKELGKIEVELNDIIMKRDAEIQKYREELALEKEKNKKSGDDKDQEISELRKKLKGLQTIPKIKVATPKIEKIKIKPPKPESIPESTPIPEATKS
jgi:hypothetical protein